MIKNIGETKGWIKIEEKLFAFWLCNIPEIGRRKIESLLDYFGCPEEIFKAHEKYFDKIPGVRAKDKEKILSNRKKEDVIKKYHNIYNKGIRFSYREEKEFPDRLKNIVDAPYGLFYRGNLPLDVTPSVAIVGARQASYEAKQIAKKFGRELAANGIQVISGMARGVDISAQSGTLELPRGRTFSVLGTGIDICYPKCHIEQFVLMQKNGGVISEFPLHTPPMPYNFPLRNRIISGLSDGILVIEAKMGSGSLITAEVGLEQGKEIFVIPGSIMDSQYEGGNKLIQSGAALVMSVKDILDGLGLFFDQDVIERKKKSEDMLETAEKIVYAILSLEPIHISQIAQDTGLELQKVMEVLLSLQIKQLVQTIGNNYYAIKL